MELPRSRAWSSGVASGLTLPLVQRARSVAPESLLPIAMGDADWRYPSGRPTERSSPERERSRTRAPVVAGYGARMSFTRLLLVFAAMFVTSLVLAQATWFETGTLTTVIGGEERQLMTYGTLVPEDVADGVEDPQQRAILER